ncbi:MAG: hypothetical protein WCO56_15410 [Verrucomicrobiota bacterium]
MNEFEQRWQECARQSRKATAAEPAPMPGFAATVWAQSRRAEPTTPPAAVWLRFALRALAAVSVLALVCLTLEIVNPENSSGLVPHVEDTVTELFWML